MDAIDLLKLLVGVLERMGLRYFVTGSMASTHYGVARFTHDIDVVVELPPGRVREFCAAFPPDEFYASEDAARDAVTRHSMFNILHGSSGLKIDVMVPEPSSPFEASRFARRRFEHAADQLDAWYASPEDVIVKKMDWYRMGESTRHLSDIANVLSVQATNIDVDYIARWADELGLTDVWETVKKRVDEGTPPR